jgi:hypothetical protein
MRKQKAKKAVDDAIIAAEVLPEEYKKAMNDKEKSYSELQHEIDDEQISLLSKFNHIGRI